MLAKHFIAPRPELKLSTSDARGPSTLQFEIAGKMWEISLQVPISALRQTQTSAKFATSTTTQHKMALMMVVVVVMMKAIVVIGMKMAVLTMMVVMVMVMTMKKNLIIMMMKGS